MQFFLTRNSRRYRSRSFLPSEAGPSPMALYLCIIYCTTDYWPFLSPGRMQMLPPPNPGKGEGDCWFRGREQSMEGTDRQMNRAIAPTNYLLTLYLTRDLGSAEEGGEQKRPAFGRYLFVLIKKVKVGSWNLQLSIRTRENYIH